jgi:hypothetical protein
VLCQKCLELKLTFYPKDKKIARSEQSSEKCEEPVENVSKIRAKAKIKTLKN